jgi:Tol biopolymer transport system component
VGTVPYMSPEQARGQTVDARTDVWAFGCVLYEMLAGRRAFTGDTASDTLAAVIGSEPEWTLLPAHTPLGVRALLHRCLQKDAARRPGDLEEVRSVLEEAIARPAAKSWIVGAMLEWVTWKRGLLWATAATLVTAAAAAYWRFDPDALPLRFANPRQITVATGVEDYPTWSPDGRRVAYESDQAGEWDIWTTPVEGGLPVNLTGGNDGEDRYPSWSPDGRQIAYWSSRDGSGYDVIPAGGGPPKRVASTQGTGPMQHGAPEWSADSQRLAYVNHQPMGKRLEALLEVATMSTGRTERFRLPGIQETRIDLAFSPDRRYLAYVDAASVLAETTQLLVQPQPGGAAIEITDARTNVRSPRWAPDGRSLYYVSNRVGPSDLWRQRLAGDGHPLGDPQRVTTGLEVQHARLSADGRRLVYSKGRWLSNVWRVPILASRRATWANAEQMTSEQAFIEAVEVSPDGRRLLFASDRMGNQDLWTMPVGGSQATRLTDDPAPDWSPTWSPDGREIAFHSNRSGDREIWVMPAAGGPARRLTNSPGLDAGPAWSPDGKEITFRSERTGSSDIWAVSADGRRLRQLTDGPAIDYFSAWSPDGRWMIFTSTRDGPRQIWRVPNEGGTPERLSAASSIGWASSPDGGQIFFVGGDHRAGNLWSLSMATRADRPMTDFKGRRGTLGAFAVSTEGRYLYFTWRDDVADLWAMDAAAP